MHQVAILNQNPPSVCQRLEAPELPEPTETTTKTTFQLPFGEHSHLSELRDGQISSADALLLCVLHYRSNWDNGKTWNTSHRTLSKLTGMSVRYIRERLSDLMDSEWLENIAKDPKTISRYQVKHHNCKRSEVPTDKNGNRLKMAVPQGKGGILERMFAGEISWKSALIWIVLKRYSDWKTGVTLSISIETLRKWVRMSPKTVSDCLKELTKAGLIKRLSKPHEAGKYQLYPKPNAKPKPVYRRRKPKADKSNKNREMKADGDWRLSYNQLWRVNVETFDVQLRKSREFGLWRNRSLGDAIPKAIQEDFDEVVRIYQELKHQLTSDSVTDTAQGVTDTAQGVTHTAQDIISGAAESCKNKG